MQISNDLAAWAASTKRTREYLKSKRQPAQNHERHGLYWTRQELHEAVMTGRVDGRTPGAVRAKLEREGRL